MAIVLALTTAFLLFLVSRPAPSFIYIIVAAGIWTWAFAHLTKGRKLHL